MSGRPYATAFGVAAVSVSVLTACSTSPENGSPVAESTTTAATSECDREPPTGSVSIPTESIDYATGDAAYSVTLSDGTTRCLSIGSDSAGGEYDSTDRDIDIGFGDPAAGLLITIDGDTEGNLPTAVPHEVEDAFIGLQVDGGYFADSMHTGCEVTLTGFDDETISGTFTCTGVALLGDGPFHRDGDQSVTPQPLDTSIETAEGWFTVRA